MNICKHYVSGKCNKNDCRFEHIDNICRNYFFGTCTRSDCKFSHDYKLNEYNKYNKDNEGKYSKSKNINCRKHIKNTESFVPDHKDPDIRVVFNESIRYGNEVSINNNLFNDNDNDYSIYNKLKSEINNDVYKLWHGDSHLIANDKHELDWKFNSPTFTFIVSELCKYFCMTPGATRLNYYNSTTDWKPYHHDAAALKPEKAKTQNITVGVSFGNTREISFESTHKNKDDRIRINFPLKNGAIYSFGNKVNIDFKHGIPQLNQLINKGTNNNNKNNEEIDRFSIIIWGFSSLIF